MKKLLVFAVAFIAFTGYSFTGMKKFPAKKSGAAAAVAKQEVFRYFRIHRQAKNVVLNWGVNSPTGISSFILERSYDGEFFDIINQTPCNNAEKFSWKDMSVFPGYIYYRIACMMTDGTIYYSPVEVIRIVQHG
jgi:hypothetical protein